jgi:transcriptional regulator with XRE-family HTH domain
MASESLGEQIRRARQRRRWSQAEAARKLGVSARALGDWERGVKKPRNLTVIEDVFGIRLSGNGAEDWYDENDPIERGIAELPRLPEPRKRKLVADLRAAREEHVPRPQDRPA